MSIQQHTTALQQRSCQELANADCITYSDKDGQLSIYEFIPRERGQKKLYVYRHGSKFFKTRKAFIKSINSLK